jgi:hypothetical protein
MLKRECHKGAPLVQAPTLLTNIRQVWKVRVLTLGQYLQPYLSVISPESTLVEHLLGDPFGQAPALFINIRPSWKYLPGTNALVYLASLFMMTEKVLIYWHQFTATGTQRMGFQLQWREVGC